MKKRFRDLSPEEARALTEDEVDQYVDLECAYNGVPLMPEMPIEPADVEATPDVAAYMIGGIYVRTEAVANALADVLNETTQVEIYYLNGQYTYTGPKGLRAKDPDEKTSKVEMLHVWSPEHYDKNRVALERYKVLKEKWQDLKTDYDKTADLRRKISEGIIEIIDEANATHFMKEDIKTEYVRYYDLAEENDDVALRFLIDSGKWPEDTIREVLGVLQES